ncbi:16S rRNA (cytidine(1402)-2'-O)-methyltransferase [Nocardia sp. NPDC051463]|uniref:16S rRNA (cytidine(1402)-2'-O)-methyltransferase n=1 Tax=Nocardia sp. NPDC051463 TaxID=3154845 RepID=UPI00344FEF65
MTDEAATGASATGRLVLGATPMGDIGDASQRLRDALGSADIIAAEDTRRTRALAKALGVEITGRVVRFDDHVESAKIPALLGDIEDGLTVLLVTDAGMPSVSDPGYRLVAACVARELPVTCLPGPSAVTTALALSGLPVERFCFDGFAPRKSGQRREWLRTLISEPRTCVYFEAPHRLADSLADAVEVLGPDRRVAVCRELTKTYEEVVRGTLAEVAAWAVDGARGEITVVVAGAQPKSADPADLVGEVEALTAEGLRLKDACARVATANGASRNELYDAVLAARRDYVE